MARGNGEGSTLRLTSPPQSNNRLTARLGVGHLVRKPLNLLPPINLLVGHLEPYFIGVSAAYGTPLRAARVFDALSTRGFLFSFVQDACEVVSEASLGGDVPFELEDYWQEIRPVFPYLHDSHQHLTRGLQLFHSDVHSNLPSRSMMEGRSVRLVGAEIGGFVRAFNRPWGAAGHDNAALAP